MFIREDNGSLFVLVLFDSGGTHHADVVEVAELLIVIQTISHDKLEIVRLWGREKRLTLSGMMKATKSSGTSILRVTRLDSSRAVQVFFTPEQII